MSSKVEYYRLFCDAKNPLSLDKGVNFSFLFLSACPKTRYPVFSNKQSLFCEQENKEKSDLCVKTLRTQNLPTRFFPSGSALSV